MGSSHGGPGGTGAVEERVPPAGSPAGPWTARKPAPTGPPQAAGKAERTGVMLRRTRRGAAARFAVGHARFASDFYRMSGSPVGVANHCPVSMAYCLAYYCLSRPISRLARSDRLRDATARSQGSLDVRQYVKGFINLGVQQRSSKCIEAFAGRL